MKKLFFLFLILITVKSYAQNNFTVEWTSPSDQYFWDIRKFEKNNNVYELMFKSLNLQTINVFDGATKQLKYSYPDPDTSVYFSNGTFWSYNALDVNNDGIYELIACKDVGFGNFPQFRFKVLNGANGQTMFQNTYNGTLIFYLLDVDGDGYTEILLFIYTDTVYQLIILSTTSTTSVLNENNGSSLNYKLEQNYPNPFNPTTLIDYSIDKNSFVKLVIYDITGREVKTSINENKNAGKYTEILNSTGLSSGTYFYQLIVDGQAEAKKMMILK
jgi:hypothetical protein